MTSSGVDWSKIQGASRKPKRLHLVGDEEGIFQCPVPHCDHMGFSSQHGCRKHVKNKHGWFYYFDVKPDLKLSKTNVRPQGKGSILLEKSHRAQTSTKNTAFGHEIVNWIQCMAGGKSKFLANRVVSPSDLTFATRSIATFLFLKIKATRPMTYQYLTVQMFEHANIDQKLFKTTGTYGFDSIILDNISMKVIGNYIEFVRPLLQPAYGFILVNRSGIQFGKLTDLLSKLVYDAIRKYIHTTRYCQIVETESSAILDLDEQQWVTEDWKHTSKVAKTHYQKKRSRDIAVKGQSCLKKLRGPEGEHVEKSLQMILGENTDLSNHLIGATDKETSIHVDEIPRANCKADQKSSDSVKIRKPSVFTPEEDEYIKRGIEKYGNLWTVMLKDPDLRFSPERTTDALIKRERSKAFREKFGHS